MVLLRLRLFAASIASVSSLFALQPGAAAEVTQTASVCDGPGVAASWPRLYVDVTGARSDAGNVTVTVYGEDSTRFLKHAGSLLVARFKIAGNVSRACVALASAGNYAIAVYHDENDNHHFDKTFIGLPAEGYGFSNDPVLTLGPPSYEQARIAIPTAGARIAIRLHY